MSKLNKYASKTTTAISKPIYPEIQFLEIIQDKYCQKVYLSNNNLNVGIFSVINDIRDINVFLSIYDYPIVLKARRGSFDGRGNIVLKNKEDLQIVYEGHKTKHCQGDPLELLQRKAHK